MDKLDIADRYLNEWTKTQLMIWREQIERLGVIRSGYLHESFNSMITGNMASTPTITMRFAEYGIYQSCGTGYGYRHENGGDLEFLDDDYRRENRLDIPRKVGPAWGGYMTSGEPRKRRDWFSPKLYGSLMAMREDLAQILGQQGCYAICDALVDRHAAITGQ